MRYWGGVRLTPLHDLVGKAIVEVVARRVVHIDNASDVLLNFQYLLRAEGAGRDESGAKKTSECGVITVPVDVPVPNGLVAQLLDGAQQLALNGGCLPRRRDRGRP